MLVWILVLTVVIAPLSTSNQAFLSLSAVQADENEARRNYQKGKQLTIDQKHDQAIEYLKKAVQLDPNYPNTYESLGLAYLATKQYKNARLQWFRLKRKGGIPNALLELNRNILETVEQDGILFTNGDEDTYPIWYLQQCKNVRKDVSIVNLSLLNTAWYIKYLRDRAPQIDIQLTDTYIDSVLTDTQYVDLYKRVWREPKVPPELSKIGLEVEVSALPSHDLLRIQDAMVIGILHWNEWKRPLYFAITVAENNRLNLDPHLRMEGLAWRLVKERDIGIDAEKMEHNLYKVYQFRQAKDPAAHADPYLHSLLGNYRAAVMQLADAYQTQGRHDAIPGLLRWATEHVLFDWEGYYNAAEILKETGSTDLAGEFIETAGHLLSEQYGLRETATYDNLLALASILLNEPYSKPERAEKLYRRAIELEPTRWDAYYELAVALQAQDDLLGALQLLRQYREKYGQVPELLGAESILQNALQDR